jgi:hypothetical protein
MFSKSLLCLVAICLSATVIVAAETLAEKWQKRINDAEANYAATVAKADNARFFSVQKANTDRVKLLKAVLSDATKAGQFDALVALREKIAIAEKEATRKPKPKNVVKFGGHEYALIEDKVTWHVAKKLCEEMGGHLAALKSAEEVAFGFAIYQKYGEIIWLGATDEEKEGEWRWVDGTLLTGTVFDERKGEPNHLAFGEGKMVDGRAGARCAFLCQWD